MKHPTIPKPAEEPDGSIAGRAGRRPIGQSFVITRRPDLGAPRGYETFKNKEDNGVEVVLSP